MVKDVARLTHEIRGLYAYDADNGDAEAIDLRAYLVDDEMTPVYDFFTVEQPIIGWSVMCSCGWRPPGFWAKETHPSESNDPNDYVKKRQREDWLSHAAPIFDVEEAGREFEAARRKLDSAVVIAKSHGISWTEIAAVLGMSRQAAHRRWRSVSDQALGRS